MNYPHPTENAHFDLGVDHLSDAGEIKDMHDPWEDAAPLEPLVVHDPVGDPAADLGPWADDLQLPGV